MHEKAKKQSVKEHVVARGSISYSILLSFGSHVGVAVAPVEGQLLLLPLIEPDQLLSAVGHKSSKAL